MTDEVNTTKRRSILIAVGVALALSLWMISGLRSGDQATTTGSIQSQAARGANSERPMQVVVKRSVARQITREVVISARTEPNRAVELRAETDGAVIALGAERGSRVAAGEQLVNLDMRDRREQLEEADALIVQRRLESEAAERLRGENFVSAAQIAEARARLVAAEAARARIMLDIRHTSIVAPFDAMVQDRFVEIGDYVKSGDSIAELVDTDPMIVVGEVNEREIGDLTVGSAGRAKIGRQEILEGTIRYLAPVAEDSTRTFRVELAIPNPDSRLRAGMTAEMRLAAGQITAHSLTPALLALADDGTVGIKAVDEDGRVRFYEVEITSSSDDGILVTGLPDHLNVISVGQGFVVEGQAVLPTQDPAAIVDAAL